MKTQKEMNKKKENPYGVPNIKKNTPRKSLTKEKNIILFLQNRVANQLKNRPFYYKARKMHSPRMDEKSAVLQSNYARIKSHFYLMSYYF